MSFKYKKCRSTNLMKTLKITTFTQLWLNLYKERVLAKIVLHFKHQYNLIGLFYMFVCVCRDKEVSRIMNTPNTEDVRLKRLLKAVKKL